MSFIPTSGLELWLPLYNTGLQGSPITSIEGNTHSAAVTGAVWTPQGRTFDGSDDVITVANSAALQVENGFTVSAWFKTSATLGVNQSFSLMDFISCNPTSGYECFYVLAGSNLSGAVKLSIYDGTYNPTATGTTDCRDDVWRMATAVWDKGNKVFVYLDDAQEGEGNDTIAGTISGAGNGTPKIGGDYTNKAACTIGDVFYYDRALTPTEISTIYLATKAIYEVPTWGFFTWG